MAKSRVWDFPDVSAGAGEEEEEQEDVLDGRKEGRKPTPNLNSLSTIPFRVFRCFASSKRSGNGGFVFVA